MGKAPEVVFGVIYGESYFRKNDEKRLFLLLNKNVLNAIPSAR